MLTRAHPAALGFRVHSGWACMVVVAMPDGKSLAVERRRLELVDSKLQSARQPYHAAAEMKLPAARAFLEQCRRASRNIATSALRAAISELAVNGCQPVGSCILMGSGRPTDDLAATLNSHPMIHTAEGHFFRNTVQKACESCGLPVSGVKEKELVSRAASRLHISPADLAQRISDLGRKIGPPWRQDEKLSTIAAWLILEA